jgi:PST family polysaccharide transporter
MTTGVAVSALSRVRDDPEKFKRYLLGALGAMAFVGMGLAADLTLIGRDLIRLLLGPGWEPAGLIFTYFAPGIGVMILYGTHGWIHLSIGRADRWLRWGFVEWIVTIALFLVFLHWGPQGIAAAWCMSFWILFIPAMYYAGKPIELRVGSVLSSIWRYIAASLLAGLGTARICIHLVEFSGVSTAATAAQRIASVSVVFVSLYLLAVVALYGGVSPLRRMVRLLREMVFVVGASEDRIASIVER